MSNTSPQRILVLIDGFNLYHSITDLCYQQKRLGLNVNYLKWLNLYSLSEAFIPKSKSKIIGVRYFTAYATWLTNGEPQRHKVYVDALKHYGVEPVFGAFKKKPKTCKNCGAKWNGHEEKASDVNIAIHLVSEAFQNTFDRAIIFTADTDIVPSITMVKKAFPGKIIDVAIPKHRNINKTELKSVCDNMLSVKFHHFANNLLPESITTNSGNIINMPIEYKKMP